jgi:hypothetical protein
MDPALAALARKYRTLAEVRRAKLRTGEHTPREQMRALAREFPGSLRELDVLPLAEVEARAAALEAAANGVDAQPWMRWMARRHELLRAALLIKSGRASAASLGVPERFAQACARPPQGRLNLLVLAELSRETGVAEADLRAALDPRRPTRSEVEAERALFHRE